MIRLILGILLTFGLALHVNGQSETETNSSFIGYLYEKPVNGLETPLAGTEKTVSTDVSEEEITAKEDDHDDDDEHEDSKPGDLHPGTDHTEKEEALEGEDVVTKNRKRESKNDKRGKKNSDSVSDISLRRKSNLRRSYSQESGDKGRSGSKQKKIRQT